MKQISLLFIGLTLLFISCSEPENNSIDLSGEWQFQMDPEDIGVSEKWFENDLQETVKLPARWLKMVKVSILICKRNGPAV